MSHRHDTISLQFYLIAHNYVYFGNVLLVYVYTGLRRPKGPTREKLVPCALGIQGRNH